MWYHYGLKRFPRIATLLCLLRFCGQRLQRYAGFCVDGCFPCSALPITLVSFALTIAKCTLVGADWSSNSGLILDNEGKRARRTSWKLLFSWHTLSPCVLLVSSLLRGIFYQYIERF